jgi:ketosteroid isomerase-like protein
MTLIFQRQERGDWVIVHEHGSSTVPFPDMDTTRALFAQGE